MAQPIIPVRAPDGHVVPPPPRTVSRWFDVALFGVVGAVAYGLMRAATRLSTPLGVGARVDLNPIHLPLYAAYSTLRMTIAYGISLAFSLAYAKIAAGSRRAERLMMPVLDILQSIPILSFMPGVVLGLAALIPGRTVGLELAAVVLIFTSQAWNLAFSFHQSLITIPGELQEASSVYRLGPWRRFTRLELPFGAISLIANSMMSWAAAWFVLTASEQFQIGSKDFRLPGLGSYLQVAANAGDMRATLLGLGVLITVIVLLDQLFWRPLVTWSDRFKFEQSGGAETPTSRITELLAGSAIVEWTRTRVWLPAWRKLDRALGGQGDRRARFARPCPLPARRAPPGNRRPRRARSSQLMMWGAAAAIHELAGLPAEQWKHVWVSAAATFARTLVALAIAAAWTIPAGVAIGFNPRWSARAQPLVQIAASIPPEHGLSHPGARAPRRPGRPQHRVRPAHAARHAMVRALQRDCRRDGHTLRSPRGRRRLPDHGLATVADADSPGDLPVSRYRDDHRDGRRVECERRLGVCHVSRVTIS